MGGAQGWRPPSWGRSPGGVVGASRDSWPLSDSRPFSWGDVWAQAARLGASGSERFCSLMSAPRDTNRVGHAPGPPGAVPEHHGLGVCFRGAGAESCLPARGHRVVPQGRTAQVPRSGLPFSTGAQALAAPDRLPAGRCGRPRPRPPARRPMRPTPTLTASPPAERPTVGAPSSARAWGSRPLC